MKLAEDGSELWRVSVATSSDDDVRGIATDHRGGVFVSGLTHGNINGVKNPSAGNQTGFVSRFDEGGTHLWTHYVEGGRIDELSSDGEHLFALNGILHKFETDGSLTWANNLGGAGVSHVGVAVMPSGSVAVTGESSVVIGGQTPPPNGDSFVAVYDTDGSLQWLTFLGHGGLEATRGIDVDGKGDIVVVGTTSGSVGGALNAGFLDIFVVKYDARGTELWTDQYGTGSDVDPPQMLPGRDHGLDVAVDSSGHAYVTGWSWGDLDGDFSAGFDDAFVTKYSPSGERLWTQMFGSNSSDVGYDVEVDGHERVYLGGESSGPLPRGELTGQRDAYVARLCEPQE